jgi:hypothetical protein
LYPSVPAIHVVTSHPICVGRRECQFIFFINYKLATPLLDDDKVCLIGYTIVAMLVLFKVDLVLYKIHNNIPVSDYQKFWPLLVS